MPYRLEKEGKCWQVKGSRGKVFATCASKKMAQAQLNLLQGVEHGWKPSGKKKQQMEEEVVEGGKIEVVNEQPILMPDESESEEEHEKKGKKKKCVCEEKEKVGGAVGSSWKAFVTSKMKGKKFASRTEVNEYMKKLSKEFKSGKKSGSGVEPLLLADGLGKGAHLSQPGPVANRMAS
jgi:hypothetical protein